MSCWGLEKLRLEMYWASQAKKILGCAIHARFVHIELFYKQPLGKIRFLMIFIYECAIFPMKWIEWGPRKFLEHAGHN